MQCSDFSYGEQIECALKSYDTSGTRCGHLRQSQSFVIFFLLKKVILRSGGSRPIAAHRACHTLRLAPAQCRVINPARTFLKSRNSRLSRLLCETLNAHSERQGRVHINLGRCFTVATSHHAHGRGKSPESVLQHDSLPSLQQQLCQIVNPLIMLYQYKEILLKQKLMID